MPDGQQPLLRCARTDIDGTPPFNGDLLERQDLAIKLTGYLDRLKEGAVLAIDAPWGEGKTWFGKNWAQYLDENDRKKIYIDSFEQDYIEDPFMLLVSEFLELFNDGEEEQKAFKEKATKVAKATMSISSKILMGHITKHLLADVDLGEEIEESIGEASGEISALTSKVIEAKFDEYAEDKQTISAFKEELKKYAESQENPIVIFIDELDRCKPDFAVRLIERIKHFFDVPNIIFVLLINREQLENAIKGVYGTDTDASAYLGKFINFFFKLPKRTFEDYNVDRFYEKYVRNIFQRYNFPQNDATESVIKTMVTLSPAFDLSLRDIEKVVALYAFAYPVHKLDAILVYVILLKQKNYSQFLQLLSGDKTTHTTMIKLLEELIRVQQDKGRNKYILEVCKEWHEAYVNNFHTAVLGQKIKNIHNLLQDVEYDITLKQMLPYFVKKIELSIED